MWAVVINPIAGRGKGALLGTRVTKYLKSHEIEFEIASGTTAALTRKYLQEIVANNRCKGVIAVGGDGLVNLAIQEISRTKIPLAVIPAGTGNDFCRTLGWGMDEVESILEVVLSSPPQSIDLGLVNGSWFGAILSTGFDSVVNERANTMSWPKGRMKYNLAMLLELFGFKPHHYEISIDGVLRSTKAMLIAVGNGVSYGGGMKVCPGARIDDGNFDIMILKPISTFEFLRVFPKVYAGTHVTHPAVEIHRGSQVVINAPAVAYADGERVGPLPAHATCVADALLTWFK
ncbi:MAG: YegS/Rv2252/BmrU family lipid kinase [Actinobacteria bacterium]|nr:YegS/Rv2252/BmrU family lipid kinase [Actinomycetota bacterium]